MTTPGDARPREARSGGGVASGLPARVAVVGAGIAGLACAGRLAALGVGVTVFEKSRGLGGRSATRRAALEADGAPALAFDHGAQYFTARAPAFVAEVERWTREGLVAEWRGSVRALAGGVLGATHGARGSGDRAAAGPEVRRLVGVPGMSALGRALGRGLDVRTGIRVARLERDATARDARWSAWDEAGESLGAFDLVVVAVPAPQAVPLLAGAPALAARAAAAVIRPCWSAMLAVRAPLGLPFAGAFVNPAPNAAPDAPPPALGWIARDDTKPGRATPEGVAETWVLHATPAWSAEHLERAPGEVAPVLLETFVRETRLVRRPEVALLSAHRWRHALPDPALPEPFLLDPASGIAACGDWCGGPRVEGAWTSGVTLADRVLAALVAPTR